MNNVRSRQHVYSMHIHHDITYTEPEPESTFHQQFSRERLMILLFSYHLFFISFCILGNIFLSF